MPVVVQKKTQTIISHRHSQLERQWLQKYCCFEMNDKANIELFRYMIITKNNFPEIKFKSEE